MGKLYELVVVAFSGYNPWDSRMVFLRINKGTKERRFLNVSNSQVRYFLVCPQIFVVDIRKYS